jgi:hypothetical protein
MAKIGELLIQKGLITAGQLEQALRESKRIGEVMGKTLVRLHMPGLLSFAERFSGS